MHLVIKLVLCVGIATTAWAGPVEKVYYDGIDADGNFEGGTLLLPRVEIDPGKTAKVSGMETIRDNGPSANRIDLVCVGDGYVATELSNYAAQVDYIIGGLFDREPYASYASYFNVHRVDVISSESGVDNDPDEGISRDTALDMGFYTGGFERALSVNLVNAYARAAAAPDVDHVFALANSTKYGGMGYPGGNLATVSAGHGLAVTLAQHESGHSLGNLADEYFPNDGTVYSGPEPEQRNASKEIAETMAMSGHKWAAWLGEDPGTRYSGLVGTYLGAAHVPLGLYRPTDISCMSLNGAPFNLPCIEAFLIEFYKIVDPIDDSTSTDTVLFGHEQVWVQPLQPVNHALDTQWYINNAPLAGATDDTLVLGSLNLPAGLHSLSVTVTDNTNLVRDEAARQDFMTQSLNWNLLVLPASGVEDYRPALQPKMQNVPNPFNPQTTIFFGLEKSSTVSLLVYDVAGKQIKSLITNEPYSAGNWDIVWNGRDSKGNSVPSGVYYYLLLGEGFQESRKMTLVR